MTLAMVVVVPAQTKCRYSVLLTVAVERQLEMEVHLAKYGTTGKKKRKKSRHNK